MNTQTQLTLDGLPDPPQLCEWLRRIEDKRWAQVIGFGVRGQRSPLLGFPICVGDVVLEFSPGYHCVTSGGAFFWERWERVELDDAARIAIESLREGEER